MRTALIRKLSVAATVAVVGGIGTLTAAPANAAEPHCKSSHVHYISTGYPNAHNARLPTISSTNTSWHCTLAYGDSGEGVRTLQWTLNKCYNAGLTIDKQFGTKTKEALAKAQKAEGLKGDGIYGPLTRGAIMRPTYRYGTGEWAGCRYWA